MGERHDFPPGPKRPTPRHGTPPPPTRVNMADELEELHKLLRALKRQIDITPHTLPPEPDIKQHEDDTGIEWPTMPHD